MPVAESDGDGGAKPGSDNGGRPEVGAAPATKASAGTDSKPADIINSKKPTTPCYPQTADSPSSPAPVPARVTSAAAAAAAVAAAAGAASTPTRLEEPASAFTKPAAAAAADLHKNSAERVEFGSSPVAYRSGFGRGYDHRRRAGGCRPSTLHLPPPPPQAPGSASWTGLRDLDGYTSSAEADIESMASVASHDSREVCRQWWWRESCGRRPA